MILDKKIKVLGVGFEMIIFCIGFLFKFNLDYVYLLRGKRILGFFSFIVFNL